MAAGLLVFVLHASDRAAAQTGVAGGQTAQAAPTQGLREFGQAIYITQAAKTLVAGKTALVAVMVWNTSNVIWPNDGLNPVNFSYHWLDRNGKVVVFDGQRTRLPTSLRAGGSIWIMATIVAPSEPGNYVLRASMVQENVAWFEDKGTPPTEVSVVVAAYR